MHLHVMPAFCAALVLFMLGGVFAAPPAAAQIELRIQERDRGDDRRGDRGDDRRKPAEKLRDILRYGFDQGEARKATCDHYGRTSIVQGESAQKFRCNFRGGRWVPNYNAHYDWCLYTKPEVVLKEVELRERELGQCFAELDEQGDLDCERYARRATRFAVRADDLRCGFKGKDWATSYEGQLSNCRRLNEAGRRETLEALRDELDRCRGR